MNTVRTFIATPVLIPFDGRLLIGEMKKDIEAYGWGVRWVNPDQLHVTLRFLGDTDTLSVPRIAASLEHAFNGFEPFDPAIRGFGIFGRKSAPRVIWMDLDGKEFFINLKEKVDRALESLLPGEEELPFKPHLTIGRVKRTGNAGGLMEVIRAYSEGLEIPVRVERIIFYKSTLQSGGPVYTPLKTIE